MGLTIHYKLKFEGTSKEVENKLKQVENKAKDMPMEFVGPLWKVNFSKSFNDEAENKRQAGEEESETYRWAKIQLEPRGFWNDDTYLPNKEVNKYWGWVVTLWTGKGCESTNIGLTTKDGYHWIGQGFTKTQYAKNFLRSHLTVIAVLEFCEKIGILEEVNDEGRYWESRNLEKLASNINESTKMIKGFLKTLKKSGFESDKINSPIEKTENYLNVNDGSIRQTKGGNSDGEV